MKVLVTGSRRATWDEHADIVAHVIGLNTYAEFLTDIVHGAAPGLDNLVAEMFSGTDVRLHPHPARWEKEGNAAGPLRNQRMLDEHPDIALVLAFPTPDSRGTWDMVERAVKARIPVRVYPL